jgi:hypothetical protein
MTAMLISPQAWGAYRSAFRSLGPKHRAVDRWRYDLKWNVPDHVVSDWLADERAKLADGGRRVN